MSEQAPGELIRNRTRGHGLNSPPFGTCRKTTYNVPSKLACCSLFRMAWSILNCARPFICSAPYQYSAKQGCEELLTAAVERGPSEGARSGSKESSSHPCATPSEAARCASSEDHQLHPLLCSASKRTTRLPPARPSLCEGLHIGQHVPAFFLREAGFPRRHVWFAVVDSLHQFGIGFLPGRG